MAAKRTKATDKKNFTLEARFPEYVGYADYFLATPVTVQVRNDFTEAVSLTVSVSCESGLLVPYEARAEVPFESAVQLAAERIFSPLFLAENDGLRPCPVLVTAKLDGRTVATQELTVTALPYDWWEGLSGNAERLAAFVRPRLGDCAAVLAEAGKRLKRWEKSGEVDGYTGTDKNGVREIAAAIFAAIKGYSPEQEGTCDLSAPVRAARPGSILKERKATALELATFAAACLEEAHLNPVLAVGKSGVAVGLWLYESCFLDPVTDDADIVSKYVSEGINNLSFFDVEDLFSASNAAFTPSEKHFRQKLSGGMYEYFVDIRRCRMDGVRPCPLRGKGVKGYELLKEEEMSSDAAPAPIPSFRSLKLDVKQPKNKQWERRLLDLTTKNALLSFTGKNALHIYSAGADPLYGVLLEKGKMRLTGEKMAQDPVTFGVELPGQRKELVLLEQQKGILRAYNDNKTTVETAAKLLRRNREAEEETGAKILYLAFGFLRYVSSDGVTRNAPLVLAPAAVARAKGNEDFSVSLSQDDGYFVNSTLLEYLKQEFNIDVRGLGGDVGALKIAEILAMVRAETANMKGWDVVSDVYLAAFSFQRYLMWNDIRSHIGALSKNKVVAALMNNRMERADVPAPAEEDDADPAAVLLPLPSDSSQYSAVALSAAGASFVLHGPPGTGKSQTITNIIANALSDGKRVLFVAEKKAALDVVKKRLDAVGIGEFCLELHSNKTDKADVLRRLDNTLALAKAEDVTGFSERAKELVAMREELSAPMRALHKKRRLGISVYQAILLYLQNKNAPDILDIESSFYDSLTESKLYECKRMILSAAAAAKECGGVKNSPFENVNLTAYSQALRDKVFCACEVMLAEIRHLKAFLALFLEFYRQKISTLTLRKVRALSELARRMAEGAYDKYFAGVDEAQFYTFYNADKRLDACLEYYNKHFRTLVDPDRDLEELRRFVETSGDWRLNRTMRGIVKKLERACYHTVESKDVPKYLRTLIDIYDAMARITANTALSRAFTDRAGRINFKKRAEFLSDLKDLHARAADVFMDYNPDAFNGMCIRATSGYTKPVLEGYLKAAESYFHAQDAFLGITNADRSKLRDEDVLDYFSAKASALIDNIDMLPNWCMYRKTAATLAESGLNFITEALESGRFRTDNVLAGFEKNVYRNFLEINIPADPALSRMTVGTLEETIEKFRIAWEEFTRLTRDHLRAELVSRLPSDGEGSLSVELNAYTRLSKSNLRGSGLRGLFAEIPTLMGVLCPCMLMSPTTVAQYLRPEADIFDLVIFDEASQMSTAEAVGSIARAKAAIVVGDPKQLPPTAFFRSAYVDEENLENEDLESVLDDCLALGMPERHLIWHYRSKHESLIAFSNSMYYDNRLCTFPSPDAMDSKVRLMLVNGVYDRGFTKRNAKEAEALVAEVVRRLSDPVLSKSSIGVVTFSTAQCEYIERLLSKEIVSKRLETVAYDREEPVFVKNLENVQGDERDVILFSVCYGPDASGRVSLNFGPLNQAGGWRRLNVAVSRAREEMLVFSTMTSPMIDLAKTSSKGVAGLKAFLEFAEKGRTTLAAPSASVRTGTGIGKYIAEELSAYGYECRYDVGASDFKVDVAVVDPANKHRFVLGVLCDGTDQFSVKDRNILQVQSLKRGNWNVLRINSVNYYNNPKREIKRIKDILDRLTGADHKPGSWIAKWSRPYKAVKATGTELASYITSGENDAAVMARIKEIVAAEEPISRAFLKKRVLATFGIQKSGSKVESRLDSLIDGCGMRRDRVMGTDYFYKNPRAVLVGKFRVEEAPALRKSSEDFTVYEIVSFIKAALEERVSLYMDEVSALVTGVCPDVKPDEKFQSFLRDCVSYGEEKGLFVRSVSDRISLA